MINPAQLSLTMADGKKRNIIIEPMLQKQGDGLSGTGVYKIYKDAFGDESHLFTEPLEIDEPKNNLPDTANPDYLGTFRHTHNNLTYDGDLLSPAEQQQVKDFILKNK